MVSLLQATLESRRTNVETHHTEWYTEAVELAVSVGTEPSVPRIAGRQVHRDNTPVESPL